MRLLSLDLLYFSKSNVLMLINIVNCMNLKDFVMNLTLQMPCAVYVVNHVTYVSRLYFSQLY